MKKYLLNVVISIIAAAILIAVGISAIDNQVVVEVKQSSFKLTDFDYVVRTPSAEQIEQFDANDAAVNSVFPCIQMAAVCRSASTTPELTLLFSDDIDDYGISLFTEKTLVSGAFDKNGLMLDETAAGKLRVAVGDEVSFTLVGKSYTLPVAAIYRASTYDTLEDGIGLVNFTEDMRSSFTREIPYTICFIDAGDESACASMLATYKPLGQLQSREEFIKIYKAENEKRPGTTEEEWDQIAQTAYETYYSERSALLKTEGNVEKKSDLMADIDDRITTTQSKVDALTVGIAVAAAVAYSLIALVLMFMNVRDDVLLANEGAEKSHILKSKLLINTACPVLVAAAAAGVLAGYATGKGFLDISVPIIMLCSLPVLVSVPVTAVAALKYVEVVFGKREGGSGEAIIHVTEDGDVIELLPGNASDDAKNIPAEGEDTPTEGGNAHTEGENTSTEGENTPTESGNTPTEGENIPTEGGSTPTEGENIPTEGEDTPTEGGNTPTEAADVTDNGADDTHTAAQKPAKSTRESGDDFPTDTPVSAITTPEDYIPPRRSSNSISKIIIETDDVGGNEEN